MEQVIDNSNLVTMCHDCGAVGFLPVMAYAVAGTDITVADTSTIPAGDAIKKFKVKLHDAFGGTVVGNNEDGADIVVSSATLNRSKPLSLTVFLATDDGITADGGAYGLLAAGDISHWDVKKNAEV